MSLLATRKWLANVAAIIARIRGFNLAVLVITPALGLYGLCTVPFNLKTMLFSVVFYIFSMLGTLS
jgi:stearoyl-CoA desaturase (Delta-9 desaturase)